MFNTKIFFLVYLIKHYCVNQQNVSRNITPLANQQTAILSAPPQPSDLTLTPQANQQIVMPSAPLQLSDQNPTQPPVVRSTKPPAAASSAFVTTHQSKCFTGPQSPATQFGYGLQPFLEPSPENFAQSDSNSEPPPDYFAEEEYTLN